MRARIQLVICLTLLSAIGCAHPPRPLASPQAALAQAAEHQIEVDDVLDVIVWKEPALSASVIVRPDGKISLPLIGEVTARGQTPTRLAQEVRTRLAHLVASPLVAVLVKEMRARRFFVLGEVAHPGAYPLTGQTTDVLQALALAGGVTEFARRQIIVLRRREDGTQVRYRIDYKAIVAGRNNAPPLGAGDTVYVP